MKNKITKQRSICFALFSRQKQTVSPAETNCFSGRNKLFKPSACLYTPLLVLLMMLSSVCEAWGQTYYVFKYDGHYLAHNGYTTDGSEICVENTFSITKCLWEKIDNSENSASDKILLKTYGADYYLAYENETTTPPYYYYLRLNTSDVTKNSKNRWNTINATNGPTKYLKNNDVKNANGKYNYPAHYICYNDSTPDVTPFWKLMLKDDERNQRAKPTVLTKTETNYKTVSSSIGGANVLDATGTYNYNVDATTVKELTCTAFTDNSTTSYWYEDGEHSKIAEDWGDVTVGALNKVWSLTGGEDYVTFDAENAVITVNELPYTSVMLTLKCTLSYGTHSRVVQKRIQLKPEVLAVPTVVMNGDNKIAITSTQTDDVTIYYTLGASEPSTPEPTKASTKYEEPFEISDTVACVKAVVIRSTEKSENGVYNRARFSDQTITFGETNVTVAPLVYSADMATPTDMTAYIVSRVTPFDHSAILSPIGYIPQGVPVLLLDSGATPSTGLTNITLSPIDLTTLDVNTNADPDDDIKPITDSQKASNQLKVSDGTVTVDDAQVYMYYQGEFVLTFGGTLKNGRFYLYNPNYKPTIPDDDEEDGNGESGDNNGGSGDSAPLQLIIEGTTGIETVHGEGLTVKGLSDRWYTLDGRQLQGKPTKKGLYINNGSKMVVK